MSICFSNATTPAYIHLKSVRPTPVTLYISNFTPGLLSPVIFTPPPQCISSSSATHKLMEATTSSRHFSSAKPSAELAAQLFRRFEQMTAKELSSVSQENAANITARLVAALFNGHW